MVKIIQVDLLQESNKTGAPITFGVPWGRDDFSPGDAVEYSLDGFNFTAIDTIKLAYWADGSVKWTSHTLVNVDALRIWVRKVVKSSEEWDVINWKINEATDGGLDISNNLGTLYSFYTNRDVFAEIGGSQGSVIGSSSTDGSETRPFTSKVLTASIENITKERVVVLSTGTLTSTINKDSSIDFKVRTYIYYDTDKTKFVASIVYKLADSETLRSLGLEFTKSLKDAPLYDRHIKFTGANGGILSESAQSITGLRGKLKPEIRTRQVKGEKLPAVPWEWDVKNLDYVPAYDEYSLTQLSSHGFEIHKRFKEKFSKLKCIGGSRNDGCVFVGSPQSGGLSFGISKFWEKYPSEISVKGFTQDTTKIQLWLYSPSAAPLEVAPYYDGLIQTDYPKQLKGLEITYEDYEPGFSTAYGVSRSFEVFMSPSRPGDSVISSTTFKEFSEVVRDPPVLIANLNYLHECEVWPFWAPDFNTLAKTPTSKEFEIENHLEKLFDYYVENVDQNDWYGFWDYGDVMHTPDIYRHQWRYDVGGYAWDNSELSTDLWLWLYFLHTGRLEVFRLAEAMTKHTGEVDVYHAGRFQGFGTRHGVQHWSDSSKQLRISNVLFRRFYYYLSGGDERIGELMNELKDSQTAMLTLDSHRKVQEQPPELPQDFAMANIGLDWGSLLGAWMTHWERRTDGWETAKDKIMTSISSLIVLPHGFANNAVLMNVKTGYCIPVPPPTPEWAISHLSTVFGLNESITELIEIIKHVDPPLYVKLIKWWTDYAVSFNGGEEVQKSKYGFAFPKKNISLQQSHARCTAHAARLFNDEKLAKDAWTQFFHTDGYSDDQTSWQFTQVNKVDSVNGTEREYAFNTTNITAQYGISAIYLLEKAGEHLE